MPIALRLTLAAVLSFVAGALLMAIAVGADAYRDTASVPELPPGVSVYEDGSVKVDESDVSQSARAYYYRCYADRSYPA